MAVLTLANNKQIQNFLWNLGAGTGFASAVLQLLGAIFPIHVLQFPSLGYHSIQQHITVPIVLPKKG